MNNEEQELRNAARYLKRQVELAGGAHKANVVQINGEVWASMLERAADRIEQLEAYIQSQGLVA